MAATMAELLARGSRIRHQARDLAAAGKPVRMRDARYGLRYLASVDTYEGGLGFRLTTFDARGPVGHCEFRTLEAAILDCLQHGAVPEAEAGAC